MAETGFTNEVAESSRRTILPHHAHANVWSYDFVQSLKSPYHDPIFEERINKLIIEMRESLQSIGQVQSVASAYDTAWVAMVPSLNIQSPQFPQLLEWIVCNQLEDGSWGVSSSSTSPFLHCDKLISTLACVLALRHWDVGTQQIQLGVEYLTREMELLHRSQEGEHARVMNFEFIFPLLLNEAKSLDILLPYNLPFVIEMSISRQHKLSKLKSITSLCEQRYLLYSLEAVPELIDNWMSFVDMKCSPASTAYVLMQTGDSRCSKYLNDLVMKYGNWVPCFFSIDIIDRLIMADNIQQLGIARHFEKEIENALAYVYKHWSNERGIGCSSDSICTDLETTSLAFRLLRLHGYDVNPIAFEQFLQVDEDNCKTYILSCYNTDYHKQSTSIVNLHKASEIAFPEESILDKVANFSYFTMTEMKQALECKEHGTHRYIRKDYAKEIINALESSWYISAPRLEVKRFCSRYVPDQELVSRSLYHLPKAYNKKLQELAILDFNILQAKHQEEMKMVSKWNKDSGLANFKFSRERPIEFFFWIAAAKYQPEYHKCRMYFAKLACVMTVLDDIYDTHGSIEELRVFTEVFMSWDMGFAEECLPHYMWSFYKILYQLIEEVIVQAEKEQGAKKRRFYRRCWEHYVNAYMQEAEWLASKYVPAFDEYMESAVPSAGAKVLLSCAMYLLGDTITCEENEEMEKLIYVNSWVWRLAGDVMTYKVEKERGEIASAIECYRRSKCVDEMEALQCVQSMLQAAKKELVKQCLQKNSIPMVVKKMMLDIARVIVLIYNERDGLGLSKYDVKEYITQCFIQPLALD